MLGEWGIFLVLQAVGAAQPVMVVAKALLMPLLLAWVLVRTGGRGPGMLVAALVFATVGDVALEVDRFLIGMLAGFLMMQICYIAGFIGLARDQPRRTWLVPGVVYGTVWVVAIAVLAPRLGKLAIPIAFYGFFLGLTATSAARLPSKRIAVGALVFLISDAMIGLGMADLDFPGRDFAVMATYLPAQYLIATGWLAMRERAAGPAEVPPAASA
jgi:uncharacterized membrane protein YhhN